MHRTLITLLGALPLCGCGLAETAATGATAGAAAAEQAKQGQQTEQKMQEQVEAAKQVAADKLRAADADSAQ
jgi:hypothetical protein